MFHQHVRTSGRLGVLVVAMLLGAVSCSQDVHDSRVTPVASTPQIPGSDGSTFTTQPQSIVVLPGYNATFTAVVRADFQNPMVAWQVSTDGGITWKDIEGSFGSTNTSTYTWVSVAIKDDNSQVRCTVATNAGPAGNSVKFYSEPATIKISGPIL